MASKDSKKVKISKEPSKLAKLYLLAYNGIQTVGWAYLLKQTLVHFLNRGTIDTFWDEIKWTVLIFQNAAVLEILHAVIGLVQSGVFLTTMQVYSRVFIVCGVLLATQAAKVSPGLPLCAVAWSVTEIIRYSYYAFNLVKLVPSFLVTLRYTLFIVLYPLGITGELLCMYHAQQEIGKAGLWSMSMPNAWNILFNYQYFMIFYMLLYIPFFPMLYGHMFGQRKKILGTGSADSAKKVK